MDVFIIAALTVDGYIARDANHLADWTSPEDKRRFIDLTKQAGVMVMGQRTFDTIGRALPGRRTIVYTSHPEAYTDKGVETTTETPNELVNRLNVEGCKALAVCGGAQIYDSFLQAGVVSDFYLTIEPLLFGKGMNLFASSVNLSMTLESVRKLNENSLALHYKVSS